MVAPTNRQEFKETVLRRCGADVINTEISDDQCEDLIDSALTLFREYNYNGSERMYLSHQITADDKVNRFIPLSDMIIGVVEVLDISSYASSTGIFSVQYQFAQSDMFKLSSSSLVSYYLMQQNLAQMNQILGTGNYVTIRFNQHTDKLYLDTNWDLLAVGTYIVAEVYRYLDPETYSDIWKDRWLTNYCAALFKKQIGTHLKKFNLTLTGGVTFNGAEMYSEAVQEEKDLMEQLFSMYTAPPRDFVG